MKIIKPSYEILTDINGEEMLKTIEKTARTCYKSENLITEDSAKKLVKSLIDRGHEAMLEFADITVKFICDRMTTQSLVRHRLCSFAQESTRYCAYNKDKFDGQLTFIQPCWFESDITGVYPPYEICHTEIYQYKKIIESSSDIKAWATSMFFIEEYYLELINTHGWTPEQARSVLPSSLKAEINMKANLREWRHIFKLRCDKAAHPSMRELMIPLLKEFQEKISVVFDDLVFEG